MGVQETPLVRTEVRRLFESAQENIHKLGDTRKDNPEGVEEGRNNAFVALGTFFRLTRIPS